MPVEIHDETPDAAIRPCAPMGVRERLINAIFGTDDEIADEIAAMTPEEVKAELEAEGIDLTERKAEMRRRFAEIRAREAKNAVPAGCVATEQDGVFVAEMGGTDE